MATQDKGRCRILIVDDEYLLATMLGEVLEEAGFAVEIAGDGQAALEAAEHFLPDLIITDFMMPRLTGLEMASALRQHPDFHGVPIILVSGAQSGLGRQRPDLFSRVLDKPYIFSELLAEIRRLCPDEQS